jgi:hypothetical protein
VSPAKCRQRRGAAILTSASAPCQNGVVQEALAAFARTGCHHAVLGLKGLAPDLSLLKPVFALRRQADQTQGCLVLCGLSAAMRDGLHATMRLALFSVRPDVPGALACLAQEVELRTKKVARQPTPWALAWSRSGQRADRPDRRRHAVDEPRTGPQLRR